MFGYHISIDDVINKKYIKGIKSAQIFLTNRMLHAPLVYESIIDKLMKNKEPTAEEKKVSFYKNIVGTVNFIKESKISFLLIHASYTTQLFTIKDDLFEKSLNDCYFYIKCCKYIENETKIKAFYNLHLPSSTNINLRFKEIEKLCEEGRKYLLFEVENNITGYYGLYFSIYNKISTEKSQPIIENELTDYKIKNLSTINKTKIIVNSILLFSEYFNVQICIDTAHISSAGLNDFSKIFSSDLKKYIKAIHLNGNVFNVGANRDKHINIYNKENKVKDLTTIVKDYNLEKLPIILERNTDEDKEQLEDELSKLIKINI